MDMGKTTGFLEYSRVDDATLTPSERIKNFNEFHVHMGEEERRIQGARCMNCGVPLCQAGLELHGMVTGCPLHNLIPEWNDEIYRGNDAVALSRLLKTNNFPEFTGRVCPALCEKACICGMHDDPVTVHENELFIIETAFASGLMEARIPVVKSGKKVAVIGGGPSGLAVADSLCHRGHDVTVFERDDRIGGLLMYGIPNMKLDKSVIERRCALMEKEGVVFRTGTDVGKDISADEIMNEFDAVALCTGAKKARDLAAKGKDAVKEGLYYAVDFLKEVTKAVLSGNDEEMRGIREKAEGKNVVIIGGGDTGNDCVGSVIRLGAKSVKQLEIMPEPPAERRADNPWPEWPKILKTDYGQQESIDVFGKDPRIYETTVKEVISDNGVLSGIKTVKGGFRDGKFIEEEDTEKVLPCELLLIAAGFTGCEEYTADAFKVHIGERGTVDAQFRSHVTDREKVFAAGDMRRGQSLVVWAIAEGRACAKAIDAYLMGYSDMEG
jgi:glutamate synthase (NADPH/NADH) small chain